MSAGIRVLQHNLNRDRTASHQLRAACIDLKIDFVLVQEPLVTSGKIYAFESCKCHLSKKSGAAIIALSDLFQCIALNHFTSDFSAAVKVTYGNRPSDHVVLVSSYFKYNVPAILHLERLEQVLTTDPRALIAADTNSPRWHSATRNRRGRLTENLIEKYNLKIHNTANQLNTFCRSGGRTSNIDVTLSTENIGNIVCEWSVKDLTDSDHRVISYCISIARNAKPVSHEKRYNLKTTDWDKFRSALLGEIGGISESSIESSAAGISRALNTAADLAIECIKPGRTGGRNIWWSPILSSLRQTLVRKRREGLKVSNRQQYNTLRNKFLKEIRNHKILAWKCFADDLNSNPWGKAFKWAKGSYSLNSIPNVMSKPDCSLTSDCRETAELLLDTFVPADPAQGDLVFHGPLPQRPAPRPETIKSTIWRIRTNGAPGADGITAGILRKAWPVMSDIISNLFGRCLQDGAFPECWKIANLIIIPKPG